MILSLKLRSKLGFLRIWNRSAEWTRICPRLVQNENIVKVHLLDLVFNIPLPAKYSIVLTEGEGIPSTFVNKLGGIYQR
jgi:hypothetical protein